MCLADFRFANTGRTGGGSQVWIRGRGQRDEVSEAGTTVGRSCRSDQTGSTYRLSLLRSSTAPDPDQDMGHHDFSFAIMPHPGRLVESDVVRDALRFTNPPVRELRVELSIPLRSSC